MSKKVAWYGMFIALAFVFSYLESLIPVPFLVPGMKLGLANVVVLVALYRMGNKEALYISGVRILLVSITFGNLFAMIYSLSGGILSYVAMFLGKKSKKISPLGVSVLGGTAHNIGQLGAAAILMKNSRILYYFPMLMIAGIVTGILIGILGNEMMRRIKKD